MRESRLAQATNSPQDDNAMSTISSFSKNSAIKDSIYLITCFM